MALTKPCVRCGKPGTATGKCDTCKRADATNSERARERGTTSARGYGTEYQRRRAALKKLRRDCCLCGEPIDYTLRYPNPGSFSGQHLTLDKQGPIDAAHLGCNLRAGSPKPLRRLFNGRRS